MIALIGVDPPSGPDLSVRQLSALPSPSATEYCGFLVRCDRAGGIDEVVSWFRQVSAERPRVALGLVCDPSFEVVAALASAAFAIDPVLTSAELRQRAVLQRAIERLVARTVEGRIREAWAAHLGPLSPAHETLLTLVVSRGIRGGTLGSVARELDVCPRTVNRWLHHLASCSGKCMMRRARVDSVHLQLASGGDRSVVLASAGFSSPEAFAKTKYLDRIRRQEGVGCPMWDSAVSGSCPFSADDAESSVEAGW
jgi:hypothetical protein